MGGRREVRRGAAGFTVIEIVVTLVVIGLVTAAAAPFLVSTFQAYVTGKDISETDWQARVATERMTRELRSIRSPADLTITSTSDIRFVDTDGNTIRYCAGAVGGCPGATGELTRNAQPLAFGIGALTFSFLTNTGAPTASAASVYYVTVAFNATRNGVTKAYQFTVGPRNFP